MQLNGVVLACCICALPAVTQCAIIYREQTAGLGRVNYCKHMQVDKVRLYDITYQFPNVHNLNFTVKIRIEYLRISCDYLERCGKYYY